MNRMGILAKKIGMTQLFREDGTIIPVTLLKAGPCSVIRKKEEAVDGYNALQIGFLDVKESRLNKPELGHFKKHKVTPKKVIREIRLDNVDNYEVGQDIEVDIFQPNDYVDITGQTIGKGFQGVVKRHNFSGLKASHGHRWTRHMGSAGAGTNPGNIKRGKKMPGRMGGKDVTVQSLRVAHIKKSEGLIYVEGSVPGKINNVVMIRQAVKKLNASKKKV